MTGITRTGLAAALLALGAGACSSDDGGSSSVEPRATTFAGTTADGGTSVAIVVDEERDALAFVTDGDRSVDWVDGAVRKGAARLGNDGGAVLEVAIAGDVATGSFTRPGSDPLSFEAAAVAAPAGLYRSSEFFADGDYVAGWIVLPDGSQRGAIRRYETPLPPGAIDATTFSAGDPTFPVPGGVLMPRRFSASADV